MNKPNMSKKTIQVLNNISQKGLSLFPLDTYNISEESHNPHAYLLRSFNLHRNEFGDKLLAVARAGAGTNNIPSEKLTDLGIPIFNTPGANANAVKELVIAALLLAARNIPQAWQYTQNLQQQGSELDKAIEAGKKQFCGFELNTKKMGILGLGAIGVKVANACMDLGMNVAGFDPQVSVENAWELNARVKKLKSIDDLMLKADIVSLHVPLNEHTKYLINEHRLGQIRKGAILINLARGGIVDEQALLPYLDNNHIRYISDFPSELLKNHPNVIALPHLGASTTEAEENCAVMAAQQLIDFMEKGHISNAINFPQVQLTQQPNTHRLVITNKNIKGMVSSITAFLAEHNCNIANMINRSKGEVAITLIDVDEAIDEQVLSLLRDNPNILSARCC